MDQDGLPLREKPEGGGLVGVCSAICGGDRKGQVPSDVPGQRTFCPSGENHTGVRCHHPCSVTGEGPGSQNKSSALNC